MSFPVPGTLDGRADRERVALRARPLLRCDDRDQGRDRRRSRPASGTSSRAHCATHRTPPRISSASGSDRTTAQLGRLSGAGAASREVLPAGLAHRRRLRRPQPDVQLRAARGPRRLSASLVRRRPRLRCGHGAEQLLQGIGDLSRSVRRPRSAAITKSIGQFQRGVSDFLSAVENFNKTMEQMNGVADRVNASARRPSRSRSGRSCRR